MGSTFTVVVIIVAALLACAAFGLALSLQTLLPRPAAAPSRHAAARAAGGRQRLDGPAQTGRQAFAPPRAPKLREPLEASKAKSGKPRRFLGSSFLVRGICN